MIEVILSHNKFHETIKRFIYEHIDSVEQLDILFFLRKNFDRQCTLEEITKELRSSPSSVRSRLVSLITKGFVLAEGNSANSFRYITQKNDIESVLTELTEEYKVRRHLVLEIIFSPLKKAKGFADSFIFGGTNKKFEEDDNG
jgi:hypothetical protein